jgi:hypothetical protein
MSLEQHGWVKVSGSSDNDEACNGESVSGVDEMSAKNGFFLGDHVDVDNVDDDGEGPAWGRSAAQVLHDFKFIMFANEWVGRGQDIVG